MKTVLIVEDEKLIRQGLRKMIQRSGVPVEVIMECNNGETALEILKEQSIFGIRISVCQRWTESSWWSACRNVNTYRSPLRSAVTMTLTMRWR
ncbi:MAG: hypothetical protein E6386_04320 [Roseburia hominis]|uniref:hypothetical protein n=1 Tax=Roseburia hominis TaxID=301301 RepID=UPI00290DA625|nr:hypothetical protein [Roseburia hominis]MDU6920442.1 hypothetical protein [Roseburia hominis]